MGGDHTPSPNPGRGIYGFVLLLTAALFAFLYSLWAALPAEQLNSIGLAYWPQQYWALALPAFALVGLIAFELFMCGLNSFICFPSLSDKRSVTNDFDDG